MPLDAGLIKDFPASFIIIKQPLITKFEKEEINA